MAEVIQKVEKLKYKNIEIPRLTRGMARDSTELIGNTPLEYSLPKGRHLLWRWSFTDKNIHVSIMHANKRR